VTALELDGASSFAGAVQTSYAFVPVPWTVHTGYTAGPLSLIMAVVVSQYAGAVRDTS
jgi:hypothetical protein